MMWLMDSEKKTKGSRDLRKIDSKMISDWLTNLEQS